MMKKRYFFILMWLVLALGINQLPAQDQSEDHIHGPIMIIDTDMGLDDAVTLALALQSPDIHLEAIISCPGVCSAEQSAAYLNRMIVEFNRSDIMLYNASKRQPASPAPPFRDSAQNALTAALPDPVPNMAHLFDSYAYKAHNNSPVTLLALGPLSNLAAALAADPAVKTGIQKIILPGLPDPEQNWNLQYDRQAYEIVRQSQIPMVFISNETAAAKPDAWRSGPLALGPNTSLGENFFRRLLAPPPVRQHYTTKLDTFYDELAFLAAVRPDLFQEDQQKQLLHPIDQSEIVAGFGQMLSAGRQRKARVVFTEQPFPDNQLNPELRKIRQRIIDKNGPDEWFAQLIMNELHDHLGAYSIIGVKMGLRAAELLNAPPHSLKVTSHVKPGPPLSCLNDGVMVATGSTPGRHLYFQGPIDETCAKVSFSYFGKTVTLTLKSEYQQQVRQHIENLLKEYTLDDPEYWDGVRRKGLDIWENWHRLDLFDIAESPGPNLR